MAILEKKEKEDENRFISQKCSNVKSDLIEITEDKLIVILNNHFIKVKKSRDWIGYLSVCVTVIIALVTCDFKDTFGVSGQNWYTIFFISAFIFGFLTLKSLYYSIFKGTSIDQIIHDIKNLD